MKATSPPQDLAELKAMIAKRQIHVSAKMQRIFLHFFEHPDDVAFSSIGALAQGCNVSISTLHRLAVTSGFVGFKDFRDLFREQIKASNLNNGELKL